MKGGCIIASVCLCLKAWSIYYRKQGTCCQYHNLHNNNNLTICSAALMLALTFCVFLSCFTVTHQHIDVTQLHAQTSLAATVARVIFEGTLFLDILFS